MGSIDDAPRYAEVREMIRCRLAEKGFEPELLEPFCCAVAGLAHERPESEFFESLPVGVRAGYNAVIDEVRTNWQDMVDKLRLATMRYVVEAVKRGARPPHGAALDVVNHKLWRDVLGMTPG